jgi:hypothetical protein
MPFACNKTEDDNVNAAVASDDPRKDRRRILRPMYLPIIVRRGKGQRRWDYNDDGDAVPYYINLLLFFTSQRLFLFIFDVQLRGPSVRVSQS